MIEFHCSNCNEKMTVPDDYSDKWVKCRKCNQPTQVPKVQQEHVGKETAIIKFRCSSCNQKIGLPAQYAGKLVRCAKCSQPTRVPEVKQGPEEDAPTKIKFASPNCNQRFSVADKYAGKQVRCTKCEQVIRVPVPQKEPVLKEPAAADASTGGMFGEDISSDDLLAMEARAPSVEDELKVAPVARVAQTSETGVQPTGDSIGAGVASRKTSAIAHSVPLAIGASFGAALLGAVLWAVIARVTGYELGIVAWGIGVLAGVGLTLFTEGRSTRLGLLAALFAFLGIMMGKVFIAKWYVMPEMSKQIRQIRFSNEQITEVLEDPNMMFTVACLELVDRKEFNEEFAWEVIGVQSGGLSPPENRRESIESARKRALELLDTWPEDRKRMAARTQLVKMSQKVVERAGFFIALIAAFSLWDLLWFPIALWSAYKIGAGRS